MSRIILLIVSTIFSLSGCAQTVEWKEDVRLLDGRVVTVVQKKLCKGGDYAATVEATCLARDAWVRIEIPEINDHEILWHENLNPMVINIFKGRLYIVGTPPTSVEFRKYGAVNPPYYGFTWEGGNWKHIPFAEIPNEIYEGNMLIESIPKTRATHVTLEQKKIETGCCYRSPQRRIDPNRKSSAH